MLTFVIPTNNRPHELRRCVLSIATQDAEDILIIDNGSTKETGFAIDRLKSEYACVRSIRFEDNIDYSVAFQRMMTAAPESTWVWTFGDDDILMKGALKFINEQLERMSTDDKPPAFIHVAEVNRASGTNGCYRGTLLDLCCQFGWLEMTGFITGNIIRADRLHAAANSPRWDFYAKSAFVHSCALLEELKNDEAAFLDLPLINTQTKEQTNDSLLRWLDQRIPERYLYAAQSIDRMFEDGILTNPLPPKFFRYLTYHLWDRFIVHFCGDYTNYGSMWIEDAWASVLLFAKHINDPEVAKSVHQDVEAARGMITLHAYMQKNLDGIKQEINDLGRRREALIYPYTFLEPPQPPPSERGASSESKGVSNENQEETHATG